jgi:hypothetical protein
MYAPDNLLIQDGMSKVQGGVPQTFYSICDSSTCYYHGSPVQNLTVGNYNDFNIYYQGGKAYFDFSGVLKFTESISACCGFHNYTDSTPWTPVANSEVNSYSDQMPGISTNQETIGGYLQERRWCGSGTCWDSSTDQGWTTNSFPSGQVGGVSQTRINASFKNNFNPLNQAVYLYDTCTTS